METKTYTDVDKIVNQPSYNTQADLLEALHILKIVAMGSLYDSDKKRIQNLLDKY